jgi:hypothetical protein
MHQHIIVLHYRDALPFPPNMDTKLRFIYNLRAIPPNVDNQFLIVASASSALRHPTQPSRGLVPAGSCDGISKLSLDGSWNW